VARIPGVKAKKQSKRKRAQTRLLDKKRGFLKCLAISGQITQAALDCGFDRSLHYDWMESDPAYPARFARAKAMGEDAWEDEATSRAIYGVYVPNVYQGKFIYPQEAYEITPAVPAGDWKDEGAQTETPAVMGLRNVPGALPLGTWVKSDNLLTTLLKGSKAKYRQNFTELTGKDGAPLMPHEIRVTFESDPESEALRPMDHDPEVSTTPQGPVSEG
jgi:hypothetical protein